MKRATTILLLLFISLSVIQGQPGSQPLGSQLAKIPSVTCINRMITMVVEQKRVTLDTGITFTTRLYNASAPGFTIRMKAGTQCQIKVVNNLPTNTSESTCESHINSFHCPDTTNLHTHGLHVAPSNDNINVTILPGHSHTYVYDLSSTVMMGTHWYHAHWHGSTALHVMGGMFGLLIVEPADSYQLPSDIKVLYDNAIEVSLNNFNFLENTDLEYIKSWTTISAAYPVQTIPPNLDFSRANLAAGREYYAANLQFRPYIKATAGNAFLLRILHASGAKIIQMEVENNACEMMVLARDGVFHHTPYQKLSKHVFFQGTRQDIVFKCASPGLFNVKLTDDPETLRYIGSPDTNRMFLQPVVFQLQVAAANGTARSFPTSSVTFPSYLRDLDASNVYRFYSFLMHGSSASAPGEGIVIKSPDFGFKVGDGDYEQWGGWEEPNYLQDLCYDKLYMIFVNSKHPYHQHINHFQIYQTYAPEHILRVGEWRDVYLGNLDEDWGSPELILMHTYDYVGDYVVHCHIVEHEDSGLMSAYNVQECSSDAGTIWNWSNANSRVSVTTRPDIFTIDVSSSITKAFEFAGNDYSVIPSNILATANEFFGRVINVRDPPYPELCGDGFGYPYCFNIQVFSEIIRSSSNSNIGNVTITLEGGMNPSRSQAAGVTTAEGRSVSVPPLGLKFDTVLTWEGERSAPLSSLGMVFEIGWSYSGPATNDYEFVLVDSGFGTVIGYRIRYGSSEQSFVFPGEIVADGEPLNGNIVEDTAARQMNSTGGFTKLYLLFEFISESSIYVDPIISSNIIEDSSASPASPASSDSPASPASSDDSSASEPSNPNSFSDSSDSSVASSLSSISFCLLFLLSICFIF